jgi:aldose 1-epimerase
MSLLHAIDGGEISLEIDVDQGGRISSLRFRDIECVLPFRGQVLTWGWYPMAPWAGRIKDGLIKNSSGEEFQLPTNLASPDAIHGFAPTSSWQEIGNGYFALDLPQPYLGARVEQRFELLDNALRWSLEYFGWGFIPGFQESLIEAGLLRLVFILERCLNVAVITCQLES